MCILFMYVANHVNKDGICGVSRCPYKLILASNRDEKFSRPTKAACFWEHEDSHILAGQDLEELGTWLGISKHGRLAMLLNVMGSASTASESTEVISRGSLVTGFLRSPPGLPGCTYLKNLCHLDISTKYKPFHLITVDALGCQTEATNLSTNEENTSQCKHLAQEASPAATTTLASICMTYLTNQNKRSEISDSSNATTHPASFEPKHMTPPADTCKFYAFGNSLIDKPFRKVECGRDEFEKLVTKHFESNENGESGKDTLVEELLQFLKSTEKYFPDEIMEKQATSIPKGFLPYLSSRCIKVPGVDYGTRTHTIVLVDTENNVTFHEWTMKPPIDPLAPEWSHATFTFTLASPRHSTQYKL